MFQPVYFLNLFFHLLTVYEKILFYWKFILLFIINSVVPFFNLEFNNHQLNFLKLKKWLKDLLLNSYHE